jgi:hypothetical protein
MWSTIDNRRRMSGNMRVFWIRDSLYSLQQAIRAQGHCKTVKQKL